MVIGSYLYSGDGVHGDWVKNGEETESVSETEGILEAFCRGFLSLQQPELFVEDFLPGKRPPRNAEEKKVELEKHFDAKR